MCPPHSRRAVVALGGCVVASSLAGCLQNDGQPASRGVQSPGDSSTHSSENPPTTSPETTERRITTRPCEDQPIYPDITIWNALSTSHEVTVTLTRRDNGEESLFFERTYEVPPTEHVTESEKIFTDWKGGECPAEVTVDSGESATADVTRAAGDPWNKGVAVSLRDDTGLEVYGYHADPGPSENPNCY